MLAIKDIFRHYNEKNSKERVDPYHPNYLFNTYLNGKTLMYIACKEGKSEILKYFLDVNLNPTIDSKINNNEKESCLEVACRWGYINVVELLLNRVSYTNDDLRKAIKCANSGNVLVALRKQIRKKSINCCF